ncbi:hypothetical protein HDU86_006397 [Geranomyces michiganensis]|nr:hypothetical protein HDU86_006397 [Geranomyces michiganensis]
MRNRGSPPKFPSAPSEAAALLPGASSGLTSRRPRSSQWKRLAGYGFGVAIFYYIAKSFLLQPSGSLRSSQPYLVHNAVIHTLGPIAGHAFVVKDGRFAAVGEYAQLKLDYPSAVEVDAKQQTIVPGLIDSHGHLIEQGLAFLQADVTGSVSLSVVREKLLHYLDANPEVEREGDWLMGKGWDQTIWPETNFGFPNATDLDATVRLAKVPICLFRVDYHAFWLNTAALERVASYLPGPGVPIDGGEAMRDANGHLTGILLDRAMDLIEPALPQPSETRVKQALKAVTTSMLQFGLTGIHDAGVLPWQMQALRKAVDDKRMPIRNCESPA